MQNSLIVYGDIGIDIHIRTTFQPNIGQDAQVDKIFLKPGGSAANCAVVAALLGVPTTFLGFIGRDYFGDVVKTNLAELGVNTKYIKSTAGDSGITVAIIEPTSERTFYSYRGVNSNGILSRIPNTLFESSKYLHISGYSFQNKNSLQNVLSLARKAQEKGILLSLDPSYWYSKEFHKENPSLLSSVEIIFPNREEASLLSGVSDPIKASHTLLEMGPKVVIIKLGSEGCYVASQKNEYYLPAMTNTKVVDTTGAGDAFCGGFLLGQINGLTIEESATIGNIASSMVISHIGGHDGAPTMNKLIKVLKKMNQMDLVRKLELIEKSSADRFPTGTT